MRKANRWRITGCYPYTEHGLWQKHRVRFTSTNGELPLEVADFRSIVGRQDTKRWYSGSPATRSTIFIGRRTQWLRQLNSMMQRGRLQIGTRKVRLH